MTTRDTKLAGIATSEHAAVTSETMSKQAAVTSEPSVPDDTAAPTINATKTNTDASSSITKVNAAQTPNIHSATAQSSRQSSSQSSRQSGSGLTWLLLIINLTFIGATVYGGYYGWHQWHAFQDVQSTQIKRANQETQQLISDELSERITSEQQRMQQQAASLTHTIEQHIAAQNGRLQDMQQQIQRVSGTQATRWQLTEAMVLIRMAGRKIWLESNPQTAILLLQQADYQLANISDSRLYLVRQKIAEDMGQLHTLDHALPDQQVLRLQNLYQIVTTLPLAQTALIAARQNRSIANAGTFWEKAERWFRANIVEINRVEQAVQPLLTEEHTWLLREQVKYQLLIAQQALLQSQADIFRNSLTQITDLLDTHFDSAHPNVNGFQAQLNLVSQHQFATITPDSLSSEIALAQFLQQKNQPTPVNSNVSSELTTPVQPSSNKQEQAL